MKHNKDIISIVLFLTIIHLFMLISKRMVFSFLKEILFTRSKVSSMAMIMVLALSCIYWKTDISCVFKKEWRLYLIVTLLFGLWHTGYAVGIYFWQRGNLIHCVGMKVLLGTLYGLLFGFIRLKTGNCYPCIIAHRILNIFG